MTISDPTLNTIVGSVLAALFALIVGWLLSKRLAARKRADEIAAGHAKVLARLAELEARERVSGEAMMPIVTAFRHRRR